MKVRGLVASIVIAGIAFAAPARKTPPKTRTGNVVDTVHGVRIADPYRWLEDQNSPETRAWIKEQNAYTRSVIAALPGRERVKSRLTELMKVEETGIPRVRRARYFFTRRLAEQDQAVLYMREGASGKDRVLVDPNPLSPDRTASVSLLDISGDGLLVAYGLRQGGEDELTIKLLDLNSGKELSDVFPRARYEGFSLTADKRAVYYGTHTAEGTRLYYREIGKPAASDIEIFGKGYGPEKGISVEVSDDGRYLIVHVVEGSAADVSEIFVKDLVKRGPLKPIISGIAARFLGYAAGDTLYVHTNWQAPNGRVLAVDLKNPARAAWKEVIPTGKWSIDDFSASGGCLFVRYLENVNSKIRVFSPDGKPAHEISFPAMGTASSIVGRWTEPEVFFEFSSFHIPQTIYQYNAVSGKQQVWNEAKIPVQSGDFELNQVWYESKDGTRVPMFLLHKKGLKLDGQRPVFLTGYGGFNVSRTPEFSATAVLWAENGGVFALPNLRGGSEFGEAWHNAGMRDRKQNVFDDFIGAAEWLFKHEYTAPSKLAISGRSNGGLLVGAAMTQRPDLFKAIICGYPLLDMVRFHKFLVARWWVPEYGSSDDPEQFKYLYAYSPYHRVKPGTKYPAVLFVTGDADTRVAPLHARKMAALLQASTVSDNPVLLRYDTKAGHSRGLPVTKRVDDLTDEMAFLFWQLGTL